MHHSVELNNSDTSVLSVCVSKPQTTKPHPNIWTTIGGHEDDSRAGMWREWEWAQKWILDFCDNYQPQPPTVWKKNKKSH